MIRAVLFFILSFITGDGIGASSKGCFSKHIEQSIAINQKNSRIYQELTKGMSDQIFQQLIAGEKASLKIASAMDKKTFKYHENGIDLFCQEFVDMVLFKSPEKTPQMIKLAPLKLGVFRFYQELNRIIKSKDDKKIRRKALEILIELKRRPNYHCFARHIVESIYRFAYYMPIRKKESLGKNIQDPTNLMIKVMNLQLLALPFAHHIDKQSAPIQKEGIPILCQDLPDLINDINLEELAELKNGSHYGKN